MNLLQNTKFKIYAPPECKSHDLNDDGTLTITGIASTTNEDLDGEIVTQEGLKSLANQVIGLNLHLDHNHKYDGGIGVIKDAELGDNTLRITAMVLPEYAEGIKQRLDLGMKFGFSIGGIPVIKGGNSRIINEFLLLEVSLTLLPANWDTFGTVETKGVVESKCLTGACHYILKNKKLSETMSEKSVNNPLEVTEEVKQELVNIVNEAIYNIKPEILDEIRGEVGVIVQDVVTQTLADLLPADEKEVDDEETLEEAVEDEAVDETVEEEATEKAEETSEPESTEEEVEVDTKAEPEEEPAEEEPADAEEEDIVEEEKDVPTEEPVLPEEPAAPAETSETSEAPKVIVDVKAISEAILKDLKEQIKSKDFTEDIVKEVESNLYKNLDLKRKNQTTKSTTSGSDSKLDQFKKTEPAQKDTTKKHKFLDSAKRDRFGRNKKYL